MEQARIIDARAAALRSRVEELAMASFRDRTSNLAGKARSHNLAIPAQGKVRAEHNLIEPATHRDLASQPAYGAAPNPPQSKGAEELNVYIKWSLLLQEGWGYG